jgi:hypothetical protein
MSERNKTIEQAFHETLAALTRPTSLAEWCDRQSEASTLLRGLGIIVIVTAGFSVTGLLALHVMAEGIATSAWDHASPQDLVWLGARMPALGLSMSLFFWFALAVFGWTRHRVAHVDQAVGLIASMPSGGPFGGLRQAILSILRDLMRCAAYVVALGLTAYIFGPPLLRVAKRETASVLRPRPVLVRLAGSTLIAEQQLRGRLGDYYVFVDEERTTLVAVSQIAELRPRPSLGETSSPGEAVAATSSR